jgi:hypothetical protein
MGVLTGCSSPHGSTGYSASVFHPLTAASADRLHTWRWECWVPGGARMGRLAQQGQTGVTLTTTRALWHQVGSHLPVAPLAPLPAP